MHIVPLCNLVYTRKQASVGSAAGLQVLRWGDWEVNVGCTWSAPRAQAVRAICTGCLVQPKHNQPHSSCRAWSFSFLVTHLLDWARLEHLFLHITFISVIALSIMLITDIFSPLTCTSGETRFFAARSYNSQAPNPSLHTHFLTDHFETQQSTLKFLLCTSPTEQNMIVDLSLHLVTTQGVYSCITLEKSI